MGTRKVARDYDFLNANRVRGIADPVEPNDAVNLRYLQQALSNLVLSTEGGEVFPYIVSAVFLYNINTSSTMSGAFGIGPGQYIALARQNTSSENGLYQVSPSGTLVRVSGTIGKNLVFAIQGDIFTSPTTFYSASALGVQIKDSPAPGLYQVVVQEPKIHGYTANIGDGLNTTYTIVHNLGTRNVVVSCYEVSTGYEVELGVRVLDENRVLVESNPAPSNNSLKVIIMSYE